MSTCDDRLRAAALGPCTGLGADPLRGLGQPPPCRATTGDDRVRSFRSTTGHRGRAQVMSCRATTGDDRLRGRAQVSCRATTGDERCRRLGQVLS
jgi:hypothetical protein